MTESAKARRMLRTREAAGYLGLSAKTLEKWRCIGGGPRFKRLGSAVCYDVADLDSWLDARPTIRNTREERGRGVNAAAGLARVVTAKARRVAVFENGAASAGGPFGCFRARGDSRR